MFCHACKEILRNESLRFCPYCGASLTQENETTQNITVKVAKFDTPTESLFQSCIQSLNDLGITINKVDEVAKYIETLGITKSPVGNSNRFPAIHIKITEEAEDVSIITVSIFTSDAALATDRFTKLISTLSSRLNKQPQSVGVETIIEQNRPLVNRDDSTQDVKVSDGRTIRTISIIIGILGGIWTAILLFDVLYMNSKLSQAAEIGFGFGALIVARLTPSIQISGIIGLLSIAITLLLLVRPSKSRIVCLLALSIVNILLSLWVVNQMPQLLYELFVVLVIGMIFNVISLIYSAYVYRKIDR
jgi:hypothetical protein